MEYKVLSNGYKIPDICFGTDIVDYKTTFAEKTKQNVKYIVKTFLGKNTQKYKEYSGQKSFRGKFETTRNRLCRSVSIALASCRKIPRILEATRGTLQGRSGKSNWSKQL